jgi:5'-nucleotidase
VRVLLSNDDGVDSPGLAAVHAAFAALPDTELWVVAPEREQSGMSHSITLKDPIRSKCLGERRYAISGSPADCVMTAVLGIMPQRPDLVVSGINLGPNLGTDLIYSGTAAAARQAAYMGIPGVAVSINAFGPPWNFDALAVFVAGNALHFIEQFDGQHFVNINGPASGSMESPVEVTHPCYRTYNDRMVKYTAPRGEEYWFLKGAPIDNSDEPGSDWNAVERGSISISPIHLHPLNNLIDDHYRTIFFRRPDDCCRDGA